jgi:CheY-like chemotaxis protein
MPEMNGLDALIAIRNEFPDAKIIMLTTYTSDTQIVRELKAGAQGIGSRMLCTRSYSTPSAPRMRAKRPSPLRLLWKLSSMRPTTL